MTWILLRSTGVVVLALLTVSVALGIVGPAIRTPANRLTSVTLHKTAGVLGSILLVAHVVLAVVDSWVTITWPSILIPGVSPWEPLWIGFGAMAFDLVLVVMLSSALRRFSATTWWNLHVVSYPAYLMAWLHAVGVGSESSDPMMLALAVVSLALVAIAVVARSSAAGAPVGVGLDAPAPRTDEEVTL